MKTNISYLLLFLLTFFLFTGQVFSQNSKQQTAKASQSQSMLNLAKANPDLKTFVSAFQESGLMDSLMATGKQFTLFAPSNAAFDSLPDGAKEDLLQPVNKNQLKAILRNHIVSGKILANNLDNGKTYTAIGGQELGVSALGGKIMVGGAEITKPDIITSSGVIHIVNKVIIPPSESTDANR